ncbi:MAG: photosystem II reaction center protein Psb28 [Cyanobacteria bacterium P01_A01_bin.123]
MISPKDESLVPRQGNDHWERCLRFMQRYAEANGLAYGESDQGPGREGWRPIR